MRSSRPEIPAPPPRKLPQLDTELYRLADGIHELGFSTLHAYALERCNRGGRWAAETRTLARRLESLPHLTNALETGAIGWSMAELLARHATPQTEDECAERAERDEPPAVQISGTPIGKVTLRLRVPGDLLLHYRQLERLHRQKLPNESFIQFLCTTFWQTWVPHLGTSDKWEAIYRRDRYRCTNPVCHQRNVTLHHVQYRANGGTDHPENLTSPCPFCHLEGEHAGRLEILPPGDNPTWLLGRHPIMRVRSRERTLLA